MDYNKRNFCYQSFLLIHSLTLLLVSISLFSDDRSEPIDIIIALDKSISMKEEIEEVKSYINEFIVEELLIIGDHLYLIVFYGDSDTVISLDITSEEVRKTVSKLIDNIAANGRYTDIGSALDIVKQHFETRENNNRKKYVLLLTDGKQEAPQKSIYYSTDGKFNHKFLENTRIIQREGWRIQVIGIGNETVAQELATELSSAYTNIGKDVTAENLAEKSKDFLRIIEVTEPVKITPVRRNGNSLLKISLSSSQTETPTTISISKINLQIINYGIIQVLETPITIEVPPSKTENFSIPIKFPTKMMSEKYEALIIFNFDSSEVFTPANFDINFKSTNFLQEYWWIILISTIIIIAISIASILSVIGNHQPATSFKLVIGGRAGEISKIKNGQSVFLVEKNDYLLISREQTEYSIAAITATDGIITITILNKFSFVHPETVMQEALGQSLDIRLSSGRRTSIQLMRVN